MITVAIGTSAFINIFTATTQSSPLLLALHFTRAKRDKCTQLRTVHKIACITQNMGLRKAARLFHHPSIIILHRQIGQAAYTMLRQFSNRHYLSKSYYTSEFPNKGTGCAKVLHSFFNEHRNQKGYWMNELRSLGVFVSLGDEEHTHENNNTRSNNEEKSTSEIQDIANYTEILKQAMYIEYKIAYDENGKEAQDIAPISVA